MNSDTTRAIVDKAMIVIDRWAKEIQKNLPDPEGYETVDAYNAVLDLLNKTLTTPSGFLDLVQLVNAHYVVGVQGGLINESLAMTLLNLENYLCQHRSKPQ